MFLKYMIVCTVNVLGPIFWLLLSPFLRSPLVLCLTLPPSLSSGSADPQVLFFLIINTIVPMLLLSAPCQAPFHRVWHVLQSGTSQFTDKAGLMEFSILLQMRGTLILESWKLWQQPTTSLPATLLLGRDAAPHARLHKTLVQHIALSMTYLPVPEGCLG